jgi:hypothetical protein
MLLSVQPDHFTADTCQQFILQYVQYYYVAICTARLIYSWHLSTVHTAICAIIWCCYLYSQTPLQLIPVNSPYCNICNNIMLLSVQPDHFTTDTCQQPILQYVQYYYVAICTARPLYSWYLSTVHTAIYAILLCCYLYSQTTLQLIPVNSPYCNICNTLLLLSVQPDHFTADICQQSILQYVKYSYVAVCKTRPLYSWYLSTVRTAICAIILCCTLYSQTTCSLLTCIADFSERFTFWQCDNSNYCITSVIISLASDCRFSKCGAGHLDYSINVLYRIIWRTQLIFCLSRTTSIELSASQIM